MKKANSLRLAGILSFAVALFQAIITLFPSWGLYFGAPEKLVSNVPLFLISGMAFSIAYLIFGLYGFSGAGDIRPLPWLRIVLIGIGSMYTLRGLLIILQLLILNDVVHSTKVITPQLILSSIVSFIIGIIYIIGIKNNWQRLKINSHQTA